MKYYKVFYWNERNEFKFEITEVPYCEGKRQAIFNVEEYFRLKGEDVRISHARLYMED